MNAIYDRNLPYIKSMCASTAISSHPILYLYDKLKKIRNLSHFVHLK